MRTSVAKKYVPRTVGCSDTQRSNCHTILELNWTVWAVVWGRYLAVVVLFISSVLQIGTKNLGTNWGSLSVRSFEGISKLATQCSETTRAADVAFVIFVDIASVGLVDLSVMKMTDWLPLLRLRHGLSMSIPTYSKGWFEKK